MMVVLLFLDGILVLCKSSQMTLEALLMRLRTHTTRMEQIRSLASCTPACSLTD